MRILGIDPGLSGALAFFDSYDGSVRVVDMPTLNVGAGGKRVISEHALHRALLANLQHADVAFLEKVGTRPGEGAVGAFSFGLGYGLIRGLLVAVGITIYDVTPQVWKRHHGIASGASKDASRALCQRKFPKSDLFDRVKDDGRADAALIACYGADIQAREQHITG